MVQSMAFPKMVLAPTQSLWFRIFRRQKIGSETRAGVFFAIARRIEMF